MRRRSREHNVVKLSDDDLLKHVKYSVETVRHLCRVYDEGHPYIAFTIASELHRLLTVGGAATRLRGTRRFSTPARELDERNMLPENKLISAQSSTHPPTLTFLPVLNDHPYGASLLAFREWWNRDIIYRAGVSPAGGNRLMIPLREEDQVPLAHREVLTRRIFIESMRNKLGAHLDVEQPEVLDELQRSIAFGVDFLVGTAGGNLSASEGTLPVLVGPAAAMTRQIAHEVMQAYTIT